ncbi:serine/threonine-protein kinase HT1-like protein [Tanacetum coccineum]
MSEKIGINPTRTFLRPSIPLDCPRLLARLIEQCWNTDPSKRPEMKDVVIELENIAVIFAYLGIDLFSDEEELLCVESLDEVQHMKLIHVQEAMATNSLFRSRSQSYSPSQSRRHGRGHSDDSHQSNPRAPKIEYITEFGGTTDGDEPKLAGYTPPSSPPSTLFHLTF